MVLLLLSSFFAKLSQRQLRCHLNIRLTMPDTTYLATFHIFHCQSLYFVLLSRYERIRAHTLFLFVKC